MKFIWLVSILIMVNITLAKVNSKTDLIFLIHSPDVKQQSTSLMVIGIGTNIDFLLSAPLNKSLDGKAVVIRVDPNKGSAILVNGSQSLTNDSAGAVPCLSNATKTLVLCETPSLRTRCVAHLQSPCRREGAWSTAYLESMSKWTRYMDITLSQTKGDITVSNCYAICLNHTDNIMCDQKHVGSPELTVGVIVAGTSVAALLLFAVVSVWKTRKHRNLRQQKF